MKVVNHIREIRLARGITQVKMAEDLQITRQTINAIEKNKYNPSLALGIEIDCLLQCTDRRTLLFGKDRGDRK